MEKVERTTSPTPTQLMNIARNLQEAFPNSYVAVELHCMAHKGGSYVEKFWLDVEDIWGAHLDTWSEVLDRYEILMKGVGYDI